MQSSFLTTEEVEILTKVSITLDYDIDNFRNASDILVSNNSYELNESETDLLLLSNAKYNMIYYINEELKNFINRHNTLNNQIEELREQLIDENYDYDINMIDLYDRISDLDLNVAYFNQNIYIINMIEKLESNLVEVDDRLTELHNLHDKIYNTSF